MEQSAKIPCDFYALSVKNIYRYDSSTCKNKVSSIGLTGTKPWVRF